MRWKVFTEEITGMMKKNQVDLMKILINSRVKSKIDKPNPVVGGTRRSRTRALT